MIYPMFAVVILTLIIGVLAIKYRFSSVRSGNLKIKYYQLMQGAEVPEDITKTTRCFNNMFEIPVLFYAGSILYLSLGIDSLLGLALAWGFVVFRYMQAFIHLTYNNVIHRMLSFWFAFLCVMGLWINLIWLQS